MHGTGIEIKKKYYKHYFAELHNPFTVCNIKNNCILCVFCEENQFDKFD